MQTVSGPERSDLCQKCAEAQLCSPVLQQSVLWDLVVGHRFPEGVNLLKNELSDL